MDTAIGTGPEIFFWFLAGFFILVIAVSAVGIAYEIHRFFRDP